MNGLKTALLLGALTAIIMVIGNLLGGIRGMTIGFAIAIVTNFVSYWFSDRIVLAAYRAQPVESRDQLPEVWDIVQDLAHRANIPMPRLYVIPTDSPNAFATGRDPEHAAVAVTQGILKLVNREELQGVLAHELSHVLNRDILISSVAATLAGAIMFAARIAQFGMYVGGYGGRDRRGNPIGLLLTAILAPIAAMLIQMAISRSREFQADESGCRMLGGQAHGLAGALQKLEYASKRLPLPASPNTAHLFIVKPFSGQLLGSLFSTHPPVEARIERLHQVFGQF